MSATVLIVDDEENARHIITSFLAPKGYEVIGAATLADARQHIEHGDADIILLDVQLPDGYGPSLLEETARLSYRPPIILITAYGDIDMAVEAMKNGAHDFLQKPIQLARLEQSIVRAQEVVVMRRELTHLRSTQRRAGMDFVTGSSDAMRRLFEQARRASQASVSVLITGETGTGKEVLAQFIHSNGPRAEKPFIAVNCAAIQSTMLESELFGYEAGAFTGADKRKAGLLEVADGGVLFLDEIASMPLDIQAKLLRVLEERAFRRVGGINLIKVDVQVLAASNRPLPKLLAEGQFREDLYYRLKVVDLHVPPLRERKGDILELVGYFVRNNNMRMGLNITNITPPAVDALRAYDWPGNVRELRNAIERAMLFCDDPVIDIVHLPADVMRENKD
jgi:DNA-binding NtrC family response regulator